MNRATKKALASLLVSLLVSGPAAACDFRKVKLDEVQKAVKVVWNQVKRLESTVPAGGENLSDRILVTAVTGTAVNARTRVDHAVQTVFASYMMHDARDAKFLQTGVLESLPFLFQGAALDAEKLKALSDATQNVNLQGEILRLREMLPEMTRPFHVCR